MPGLYTGGHNPWQLELDGPAIQYIDCYRCPEHPGGPPRNFWGTQPDDDPSVPTADALRVPWPNEETTVLEDTVAAATMVSSVDQSTSYHQRTFSASTDPLQWDQERVEQESTSVVGLSETLSRTHIETPTQTDTAAYISSADSQYVNDACLTKHGRVTFTGPDGRKLKVERDQWTEAKVDYEGKYVDCWVHIGRKSGTQFYAFSIEEPAGSSSKS